MRCIILLLLFFCNITLAHAQHSDDYQYQRELFLRAENELKHGNYKTYREHKQQLRNYPLLPYLEYTAIANNLDKTSISVLYHFMEAYHDSPLANRLSQQWLIHQAKKGKWQNFLQVYTDTEDTELQCYFLWAHYQQHADKQIFKYVPSLWLTGEARPKSCDHIFSAWDQAGYMTRAMVWQRIKLAIQRHNLSLAKFLANRFSKDERNLVELWLRVDENPNIVAKTYLFYSKHPAVAEILVHGIKKIAPKDPELAIQLWQSIAKRHNFSQNHWLLVVKSIGISLASDKHPDADKWLNKIPAELIDQAVVEARLRIALNKKDWSAIAKLHNDLPPEFDHDEKFLYWYAVALNKQQDRARSTAILQKLASQRSYYGFLSAQQLRKPYAFKDTPIPIHESDLSAIGKKPGIARAYELQHINRFSLADAEWRRTIKTLSNKEKEAAAVIAAQWKNPNWAIVALANADSKNDLSLRFPKSFSNHILRESKRNNLDPALIFAITRQESAFVPTAQSPVGALGLMQLMPSTGRMLAKNEQMHIKSNLDILAVDKNIRLGSKYFRMMLDKYQQNPVLAAAAYNAGPQRVLKWLPESNMPADRWIESIPYKETRNYVQNILTYTVIYQQLLDHRPQMNLHMPIIVGKSN